MNSMELVEIVIVFVYVFLSVTYVNKWVSNVLGWLELELIWFGVIYGLILVKISGKFLSRGQNFWVFDEFSWNLKKTGKPVVFMKTGRVL